MNRIFALCTSLATVCSCILLAHCSSTSSSGGTTDSGTEMQPETGTEAGTACTPPDGGKECTPGTISCGTTTCAVPATSCCELSNGDGGTTYTCEPEGTACTGGTQISCNETSDCSGGDVCCIAANTTSTATVSCQKLVSGKCPAATIGSAQICRSSTECNGSSCQFWSCLGNTIEACTNPVPGICTAM